MSAWIKCSDRLPPDETDVLIVVNGQQRIGALFWETPTFEETFKAFRYWDDAENEGQSWEWDDVTHWQPLPPFPPTDDKDDDK